MPIASITADDRLKLLGLWTLATEHYRKCREAEHVINRMLGLSEQGAVSDAIYRTDGPHTVADFDDALVADGVAVDG